MDDEEYQPNDVLDYNHTKSSLCASKGSYASKRRQFWPAPSSPVLGYTEIYKKMGEQTWPYEKDKTFDNYKFLHFIKLIETELKEEVPRIFTVPFFFQGIQCFLSTQKQDPIPACVLQYVVKIAFTNVAQHV